MERVNRGFSLTETVIAAFLLLMGFLLVFSLFHVSLQYSSRVEQQALATMVAEKNLDAVRIWAQEGGGPFNFEGDWSAFDDVTFPDPDYPDMQVHVKVEPFREVDTPSSALEAPHAGNERRMRSVLVPLRVEVSWDPSDPSRRVRLDSYVAEAPRQFRATAPLVVTAAGAVPSPVPQDATVFFEVEAFDANGNEIQDLMVAWSVEPVGVGPLGIPGNGTLVPATRDGRRIGFQNRYRNSAGVWVHTGGECVLRARARYGGVMRTQDSQVLQLEP